MKIYFSSDLHYGVVPEGDRAARGLAADLRSRAAAEDVLVLAGDLAAEGRLSDCLALFAGFPGRKLAVLGNHDIWTFPGSSSRAQERLATAQLGEAGFVQLQSDGPVVIDGIGFAGSMGWYDYSFRDRDIGIGLSAYELKTYPGERSPLWADALKARWPLADKALARLLARLLGRHLKRLQSDPAVRETVVVTHHVPTKRLLIHPRCLVPRRWRFANAFLGSESFARVISRYSKVRLAVCGHVHQSRATRAGGVDYVSIGGDYITKQLVIWEDGRLMRQDFAP